MIVVDTQILVYAIREDSIHHARTLEAMKSLAEGPTPVADVLGQISWWLESPRAIVLQESPDHLQILDRLIRDQPSLGPQVHDARIAAICLGAGVRELWAADRDFSRFPALRCRNPLWG